MLIYFALANQKALFLFFLGGGGGWSLVSLAFSCPGPTPVPAKSKMAAEQGKFSAIFQSDSDQFYCKEILQNLNSLRHEGSLCDVTLVVEGREFRAHRNVLAASSPYFRNIFTSDMREKT